LGIYAIDLPPARSSALCHAAVIALRVARP
jgi:hypothetical protein